MISVYGENIMSQLLNNCPSCKANGEIFADHHGTQKTTGYYWIECKNCKTRTKNYPSREEAAIAWNKEDIMK